MAPGANRRIFAGRGKFFADLRDELKAHAEKWFRLNADDGDGASYRETLQGLLERTRNPARVAEYEAELACPALPPALVYIWDGFLRLHARRSSNGFGANPIGWPDIDAFVRHARVSFAPWEIRVIEELDDIYRAEQSRASKAV